jgi:transcriptional regulator with XRE-family HTH domain
MALGETLRDARTRKGWSTAQVADATRMMVQVVEELEREDFRRIAAPIYGRGFIKLYAEHVGVDPEPLIQEFVEIYTGARAPQVARRAVVTAPEASVPVMPAVPATVAPMQPAPAAEAAPLPQEQPMEKQPSAPRAAVEDAGRAPVVAEPSPSVAPVEDPVSPAAEDDLFAAASRRQPLDPKPDGADATPPRVNPVGVRAIRRPMPLKPAIPAAVPAPAPVASRSPTAPASVVAGLQRLWGGFGLPVGWFTRRRVLTLSAAVLVIVALAIGMRMLLKVTARGAVQGGSPASEYVLPPPDAYVD